MARQPNLYTLSLYNLVNPFQAPFPKSFILSYRLRQWGLKGLKSYTCEAFTRRNQLTFPTYRLLSPPMRTVAVETVTTKKIAIWTFFLLTFLKIALRYKKGRLRSLPGKRSCLYPSATPIGAPFSSSGMARQPNLYTLSLYNLVNLFQVLCTKFFNLSAILKATARKSGQIPSLWSFHPVKYGKFLKLFIL
jgi:hypothetical protein